MKFPLATLNKTEYLEKIASLLVDSECKIFIDTNIFALFFRIYSSARKEFFEWIFPLAEEKRICTPVWALNEYTNRFIRNQIEDYFSPLKKWNTIQRDFKEINNFLKMNVDSASLGGTKYASKSDYLDDLNLIEVKLKSISVTTRSKDESYKNDIHNEIQNIFEKTVIKSNLVDILEKVDKQGSIRLTHKLPPGFEDEKKDLNFFGDLIIWHEILDFCKLEGTKKAILLTNDNKKDWVYAPNRIIENTKIIPNSAPEFKIADTRLIYEFFQSTGSEEFYIINFETLTKILINNSKGGFIELAKALQLATASAAEDIPTELLENGELPEVMTDSTVDSSNGAILLKPESTLYSDYALADMNFPLNDSSFLTETIINLKTTNWYVQNPALQKFRDESLLYLPENQDTKDKLFVLGRNIYQSACGGARVSVEMIRHLKNYFSQRTDFIISHLYSGMFYEIYFNSKNEFRDYKFKSTFINEIFELQELDRLKNPVDFIHTSLIPFKEHLIILPSKKPEKVDLLIDYSEIEDNAYDFLGIKTTNHLISDIKLNNVSVLTSSSESWVEGFYQISGTLRDIEHLLSITYAIPTKQMNIIIEPTKAESYYFRVETNKKLGKL